MRLKDEVAGKRFRCAGCQQPIIAPHPAKDCFHAPVLTLEAPAINTHSPRPQDSDSLEELTDEDFLPMTSPPAFRHTARLMPGRPMPGPPPMPRTPVAHPVAHAVVAAVDPVTEFKKVIREIGIFWIGIGVLIGFLGVVMWLVMESSPGPRSGDPMIGYVVVGIVAVGTIAIGALTFSGSRIWLYCLYGISGVYLVVSGAIGLGVAGPFAVIPIAAFIMMMIRITRAHDLADAIRNAQSLPDRSRR
ncbi:MAG: hypothetical protein KDA85_13695 [Planctomycetaceae bacterium]|nr:hypothetical protein [Planctomycetaceae bacterium]